MNKKSDAQQTNKADEIRALSDFQAAQANGSYLSMFLTDELVAWVAARIREDGNPDIMAQLDSEIDRTNKSGNAAEALRLEVERQKKIITDYQTKHETAVRELNSLVSDYQARLEEKATKFYDISAEYDKVRSLLSERDLEIMRLKARLFDLMEKGQ